MEKIKNLKKLFKTFNLDGYIVPKNDEFFGEYVPVYNDRLKFISNFSGSYGFAIILKKKNYLFVDGRYSIQAKNQSAKQYDIITIPKTLPKNILKNKELKIGFDPKLHTSKSLSFIFKKTKCKLLPINKNLIDEIWSKNIKERNKKFFVLNEKVAGQSYRKKIDGITKILNKNNMDFQLISAPENIAWILNLRGHDSKFSPIPNSILIVDNKKNACLFCQLSKINKIIKKKLNKVSILNIENIHNFIEKIKNKNIQIDANSCSIFFENKLKKNNKIFNKIDPTYFLKSIKNKTEINNTIESHLADGAALTKFLFWLKNNYDKKKISEISAQNKLLKFRKKNKNFLSLSFPTISGSGPNGAIIHYNANKYTDRILKKGDIYLIDSGGQYNFGTTDVTRTISLNNNNRRIRNIFTRVLKGHIAVANFKLDKNTCGAEIDISARQYLKQVKLDYEHGTGHGVGYYLNVHEGPQAISKNNKIKIKEGMILSNEPGYYEKGKFGIRIENLITVIKKNKILKFKNLTMAPIDKSMIDKDLLNKIEINWLNNYHKIVLKNLKKFMNSSELKMLKENCSNI